MSRSFLIALGCLMFCASAQAASFDCANAQSRVEHLICADADLSKLDEEMATAYATALRDKKQSGETRVAQRLWVKKRNGCVDRDCLEMAYRIRAHDLTIGQAERSLVPILSKNKILCETYERYVLWEIKETEKGDRLEYRRTTSLGAAGHLTWFESPPQCKRPFGEKFVEFRPVKWREINPVDYPELSGQVDRYLKYWPWNRQEVAFALTDAGFKEGAKGMQFQYSIGWMRMWLGEADILNVGRAERLLKVDDNRCGYDPRSFGASRTSDWRVPVMVIDETGKKIDTAKSELLLGVSAIPKILNPPTSGMLSLGLQSFDVFNFSGSAYFDRWEDEWVYDSLGEYSEKSQSPHSAALTVYSISQDKAIAICRFKVNKKNS